MQTHTAYDYESFPCRVVVGKTAEISIRFTPSRRVWQNARVKPGNRELMIVTLEQEHSKSETEYTLEIS